MASSPPEQQKGRDGSLTMLTVAIESLNLAKAITSIALAKAAFGSVSNLLAIIRDTAIDEQDYVDIGLFFANICESLHRGLGRRQLNELSQSVFEAIAQLTITVGGVQKKLIKRGKRNAFSRVFHRKDDKESIAAWRQDLDRVLHIFNTELSLNTHLVVLDARLDVQRMDQSVRTSGSLGESPPPPPRSCFGRDELMEKIVGLVENLKPVALIGAGGIGKTSIALTVLHCDRIKKRFGDNRRFIHCDRFPPSRTNFLARLSKVIGAGVENPEDLTALRPHLSSREMVLFLDNAESILDPQGADAQEIYGLVEELSQFSTICLGITSRISTVPPLCETQFIPTLTMEAACDTFYAIYHDDGRSDIVNNLVRQLDFHPLSVTLLATVASHNMWDYDRLAREWEAHRAQILQTGYNSSLPATIELSLSSPTFLGLGPDARELLGVVAFFPQGVNENNLDWLFPTIPNIGNIFDKLCVLSLSYRINGFVTILAPIRDYLCPKDPKSSPLLCSTKDRYFSRLSVDLEPGKPGFEEARWIRSEDVNIEYLLNVFIVIDTDAGDVWDACVHFMEHLYWHKRRRTMLEPQIEGLPDDHPSKRQCLFELSRLFESVGNFVEQKRLLSRVLELEREQGDGFWVAEALVWLSGANRLLGLYEEGIQQAREALDIYEGLCAVVEQAICLSHLSLLLYQDKQLDVAEEAASRAIDLFPEEGQDFLVSQSHRFLGDIYHSKGKREKAVHHYEVALEIASRFDQHHQLFWIHYSLAELFLDEDGYDDAHSHIEQAKSHAVEDAYSLGRATKLQARTWFRQGNLEDATSEALRALGVFENLGAANDAEGCKDLLRKIEQATKGLPTSTEQGSSAHGTLVNTSTNNSQDESGGALRP